VNTNADTSKTEMHSREMANALLVLIKTSMVYDLSNAVLERPLSNFITAANQIVAQVGGAEIRFLGDMVYVNRVLVRPDSALFTQVRSLSRVLNKLKLREMRISAEISNADILEVLSKVKEAMNSADGWTLLHNTNFENVSIRDIAESHGQSELSPKMKAMRAYIATLITIRDLIAKIEQQKDISIAPTKRATRDLVSMVYAQESTMLGLIQMQQYRGKPFNRLVNCAVLVAALCRRLNLDRVTAAETALGAALHDLDWTGNHDSITSVRHLVRIYRSEQVGLIRTCVTGDIGAPDGLGPSRLISVAEAYERLTTMGLQTGGETPKPLLPDEALRQIESLAGTEFDPVAIKLLINLLGVYPIGTTVQLSTGEIAIVIELPSDGRSLSLPIVKVVKAATGSPSDGRLLDLHHERASHIARSVAPESLKLNVTHFFLA
jgi:HD-GYP domain-containing protein (c-di-GMP phosphodiesterase class II)